MKLKLFSGAAFAFFIAGIIFWGGFNTAMEATNTPEFCISCHEMESTVYQEYRHSVHYRNSSGVQATCPDCHVPKEWIHKFVRKVQASAELYHWAVGSIDTREKFEAKRGVLAEKVWTAMQKTDSRECRNCHLFDSMELEQQGYFARNRHTTGLAAGKTCIDCHKGISHQLPKTENTGVPEADADLEYGEEINETCAACHGEYSEGKPDGEYPRLAGLPKAYIAKQLRDFKSRERLNIPMLPYATERELPEEDLVSVAAYLEQIDLPTRLPPVEEENFDAFERLQQSKLVVNIARLDGDIGTGKHLYQRECGGCHAQDGYGKPGELIPPLTGQHSEYLRRQMVKFRKGERLHADSAEDQKVFEQISERAVHDILSYLSILDDRQ